MDKTKRKKPHAAVEKLLADLASEQQEIDNRAEQIEKRKMQCQPVIAAWKDLQSAHLPEHHTSRYTSDYPTIKDACKKLGALIDRLGKAIRDNDLEWILAHAPDEAGSELGKAMLQQSIDGETTCQHLVKLYDSKARDLKWDAAQEAVTYLRHGISQWADAAMARYIYEASTKPNKVKNNEPFIPSGPQKRILEKLNNKAMRRDELAHGIAKDKAQLHRDHLKEMLQLGIVKKHKKIGYYRPDAPPKEYAEILRQ